MGRIVTGYPGWARIPGDQQNGRLMRGPLRRVQIGVAILALVVVAGTTGYLVLGFSLLNALYQTVVTISTVGYAPAHTLSAGGKIFTIFLILFGVGTALYTFTVVLEVLIEGHLRNLMRRKRMERDVDRMQGHVIVCGWGRVGREVARFLVSAGKEIVVVDRDTDRIADIPYPHVTGDVTDDATLHAAGVERADTLVAALDTDADNLYVTVSSKALSPTLQVIARARSNSSEPVLRRAGADRVVNPQQLGGDRMASFVVQPDVVDFVDVVMHDGSLEFRLGDVPVNPGSTLVGETLSSARVHDRTGALVLAIRHADGSFTTNPVPQTRIEPGDVLIGVGTAEQLSALTSFATAPK
jgi:voltage-gated potassium channel